MSFVGLSVGFPRYARGALRFFVYLEAHCAFLIYITLLIKKKKAGKSTVSLAICQFVPIAIMVWL
jgi:hypothetical protein